MADETATFVDAHPRSAALHQRARDSLLSGLPMPWMSKWAGPFPPYVESASGAHFRCVDGHDYVDFCLGDTGAMAGHGPAATMAAVERQMRRGITHMLPTEDATWVGAELTRRFGVGSWQFALSASDANRWVLRLARMISGRSKVAVHDHCYHGLVAEAIAMLGPDGTVVPVRGSVGPQVDETHTICAGSSGATGLWGLQPDIVVIGKTIGGGIPSAAYGFSPEVASHVADAVAIDDSDVGG